MQSTLPLRWHEADCGLGLYIIELRISYLAVGRLHLLAPFLYRQSLQLTMSWRALSSKLLRPLALGTSIAFKSTQLATKLTLSAKLASLPLPRLTLSPPPRPTPLG